MYLGPPRFSLTKRLAARTSVRRRLRNSLGLRAPAGWGWVTNPRRAAYNRVYRAKNRAWRGIAPLLVVGLLWLLVTAQAALRAAWWLIVPAALGLWYLRLRAQRQASIARLSAEVRDTPFAPDDPA